MNTDERIIVEDRGQQYYVFPQRGFFINKKQNVEKGDLINLKLLFDGNKIVNSKIQAKVLEPLVKGEKRIIWKMKRRKNYEKRMGFRPQYTKVAVAA